MFSILHMYDINPKCYIRVDRITSYYVNSCTACVVRRYLVLFKAFLFLFISSWNFFALFTVVARSETAQLCMLVFVSMAAEAFCSAAVKENNSLSVFSFIHRTESAAPVPLSNSPDAVLCWALFK